MTREQAQAILENIDIIRHYANGGDIGFRLHNYKGEYLGIHVSNKINLCNLRPGVTNLVMLKPRLRVSSEPQCINRVIRAWYTKVGESEVLNMAGAT